MTLYYDKISDRFSIDVESGDSVIVCESHEKTGYKYIKWESEDRRIKLNIQSNFGFGSASYFYFTMIVEGRRMLNIGDYVRYYMSQIIKFNVLPNTENWYELLNRIVSVYNEKSERKSVVWLNNKYESALIVIEKYLDSYFDTTKVDPVITLKQYSVKNPQIKITGKQNCARVIAEKLNILINMEEFLEIAEISQIQKQMERICVKATKMLSEAYKLNFSKTNTLNKKINVEAYEKCIDSIYDYLKRTNKRHLFLQNF